MSSKKIAIMNSLENLSGKNLDKFRVMLVDRRGDRKVPLSKVEGKDYTEFTNVLVSTFTEDGAPAVTSELLESIGCFQEAKELDDKIAKLKSSAAKIAASAPAATAAGSAGAAGGNAYYQGSPVAKTGNVYYQGGSNNTSNQGGTGNACYQGSAVATGGNASYQGGSNNTSNQGSAGAKGRTAHSKVCGK
ncbi:uncharacterized protein LOC144043946 isoform X2 [Vanacampus margaritifer]